MRRRDEDSKNVSLNGNDKLFAPQSDVHAATALQRDLIIRRN